MKHNNNNNTNDDDNMELGGFFQNTRHTVDNMLYSAQRGLTSQPHEGLLITRLHGPGRPHTPPPSPSTI